MRKNRQKNHLSEMFSRNIYVDGSISLEQAIKVTKREQHIDDGALTTIPVIEGNKEVFFFKLSNHMNHVELEGYYEEMGLVACDSRTLCQINIDDPVFSDSYHNITYWKDNENNWYYICFSRWVSGRYVKIHRCSSHSGFWSGGWWYAGLRNIVC